MSKLPEKWSKLVFGLSKLVFCGLSWFFGRQAGFRKLAWRANFLQILLLFEFGESLFGGTFVFGDHAEWRGLCACGRSSLNCVFVVHSGVWWFCFVFSFETVFLVVQTN